MERLHEFHTIPYRDFYQDGKYPQDKVDIYICNRLGITSPTELEYLEYLVHKKSVFSTKYLQVLGHSVKQSGHTMTALDYYLRSITYVEHLGDFPSEVGYVVEIYRDYLRDEENTLRYQLVAMKGNTYRRDFIYTIGIKTIVRIYKEYCWLLGKAYCPLCNCNPGTELSEKSLRAYYNSDNAQEFVKLYADRCDLLRVLVINTMYSYMNLDLSRIIGGYYI